MTFMTDERRMLQEAAREFAMREVLPLANKLDPERADFPESLIEQLADMGYLGIVIPEEHGGLGLGCFEYCIVAEELSRAWMSVGSVIRSCIFNTLFPLSALNDEQRSRIAPRLASGEYRGAFSMSEPGAGSDAAGISCRARRDGDSWVLNGNKYWCTYADQADFIIVMVRTDPDIDPERRHRGISALLIDKPRGTFPPEIHASTIPKIGYFGWKTFELAFDNLRVPAENLLGKEGDGFYMMSSGLEIGRAHTAARAIGVARGALEDASLYAMQRKQFGQAIGEFQAIRFKIARMAAEIEASRQLMYSVCEKVDQKERCDLEASMAKYVATEMAERVTSEGLQIHGGAGYTTLTAAERYWRDARLTKIFEGTSEIQLRIISDRLLGKSRG
jgi:alkylation response protein AidB-like acyl-CoA dehydrogenase